MDVQTFTENVLENKYSLYRVAKSILQSDSDAEDAVSEAILKSYSKLATLRQEAFFKTWLTRILINECYKMRKKKTETVDWQDCEEFLPSDETMEYHPALYESIMKLPPKMRMVIVLYYVEGYQIEEIQSILHIPAGTVKSRLFRGRTNLKKLLESEEMI